MNAADELVAFLRARGGEAPASACTEHLRARGFGSAARKSAKERAGVVSRKSGYGGRWLWRLPDAADTPAVPGGRPPEPQPEGGPVVTIVASPGPRNARTDPETGLRSYTWQGRDLPSVTSLRRMAGISFGLHQWAIGKVVEHAIDHWPDLSERLSRGTSVDVGLVRKELRGAATAERDRAASLGTAVHEAAATGRNPEHVPDEVAPRLRQFLAWKAASQAEIVASEFQVFSTKYGYAGSCDALVRFADGSLWIVDYKTGKGIYAEHALQLMAYTMADVVGADDVVDERLTELLHQVTGMAVLHLNDEGWEFHALEPDPGTWTAFRGLLAFATWIAAHGSTDSFVRASRSGSEAA